MPHPISYTTVETLSGNRTLTQAEVDESQIWVFDPGGSGRLWRLIQTSKKRTTEKGLPIGSPFFWRCIVDQSEPCFRCPRSGCHDS